MINNECLMRMEPARQHAQLVLKSISVRKNSCVANRTKLQILGRPKAYTFKEKQQIVEAFTKQKSGLNRNRQIGLEASSIQICSLVKRQSKQQTMSKRLRQSYKMGTARHKTEGLFPQSSREFGFGFSGQASSGLSLKFGGWFEA